MDHPFLTEIRVFVGGHRIAASHMRDVISINIDLLNDQGIHIVDPTEAKKALVQAFRDLKAMQSPQEITTRFLATILPDWEPEILVIGHEALCGNITRPASGPFLYGSARSVVAQMTDVFKELPLTFCFGIRSPATFLPSAYAESVAHAHLKTLSDFLDGVKLDELKWSKTFERMCGVADGNPILTWRFEDYPYIWRDVIGAITGMENPQELVPTNTERVRGLSLEGAALILAETSGGTSKRPFADLLEATRADYPASDQPTPHAAWPQDLVDKLEAAYRADWPKIETMDGVAAITRRDYR